GGVWARAGSAIRAPARAAPPSKEIPRIVSSPVRGGESVRRGTGPRPRASGGFYRPRRRGNRRICEPSGCRDNPVSPAGAGSLRGRGGHINTGEALRAAAVERRLILPADLA